MLIKNICLATIIILIVNMYSVAQHHDEPSKKIPKHKTVFSIGLTASPDYYIYDFKAGSDLKFTYKSYFNYSFGLTGVYYPIKFISLRYAILYSTKGYSVDYNYNITKPVALDDPIQSNIDIAYLDIPVILHFNLIHKDKIQLFMAAGVVPGVLLTKAENSTLKNNDQTSSSNLTNNMNEFLAGTIYSFGFKYNFSYKVGIGLDPYFRYYLNKIDNSVMAANPISFGAKFALYYNFIHKHHRHVLGKGN